ncbi:MAG: T9SS type A sorting domain-containing protein [Cytophagaceae bacterium]|nr:T9SS type A sorting domain-containing protein [Cytophagaceae bacterium]
MKIFTILLLALAPISAYAQVTLFSQNFSSSNQADYVSASPSTGQFTDLAVTTGASGATTLTLSNGKLEFTRPAGSSGTAGSGVGQGRFNRLVNFMGPPTAIKVEFKLSGSSTSLDNTTSIFYVGDFSSNTGPVANASVHSRIAIVTNGTGLLMRVVGVGGVGSINDMEVITGEVAITWVINNSGLPVTYLAPNGSSETVGDDKFDLWVGTRRAFNEIAAITGSQSLNHIKFNFDGGVGTIAFDDLKVTGIIDDPTPVELTYFRAQANAESVGLQWGTASEQNSKYFAIERSVDALEFTEIARRDAAGNSKETIRYELTDEHPLPGTSYYRLRQVDTDGLQHVYRPVSVVRAAGENALRLYPNPTVGQEIRLRVTDAASARVSVTRLSGQDVPCAVQSESGNTLRLLPNEYLAAGVYLIRVQNGERTKTLRWVVQANVELTP